MRILLAAPLDRPNKNDIGALVARLAHSIQGLGHEVDVFHFPASASPAGAMESALSIGLLDLGVHADRLLTVGWPCHLLRHPSKIAIIPQHDITAELINPKETKPYQEHIRAAVLAALLSARNIVVEQSHTAESLRNHIGVMPQVSDILAMHSDMVEAWLD